MRTTKRRDLLVSSGAALFAASGCTGRSSSATPAHWVTVYLVDASEARDVTVTVENQDGDVLFEQDYRLSEHNEADEDAPFPESTEPETVVVTVDGTRFEYDWPGFERPQLPCNEPNYSGVSLWIENGPEGSPTVRLEPDCQHVTMD